MADKFFLIDGYNLLHAAGLARVRYGPGGLERARLSLLRQLLTLLTEEEVRRTIVVFDARRLSIHSGSALERHVDVSGLAVLFVPDADVQIERLIAKHCCPKQLQVVSSDRRLQLAARRRKAQAVKSEDFWERLCVRQNTRRVQQKRRTHPKFTGEMSASELAMWEEIFGEIPEAAELRQEAPECVSSSFWEQLVTELLQENRDVTE